MNTYLLAKLVRQFDPTPEVKVLPTFRKLVEEGKLTPKLVESRSRGLGVKGTIAAFRLIGYMVEKQGRNWVIIEKGDSTWY
jgi:hypothetical protein